MPQTPPIDRKDFPTLLSYCPDLREMTAADRERLAGLLEIAWYPRGHAFFLPGDGGESSLAKRKLRIVVGGHIQEERPGDVRGRRSMGPLGVHGEEAVVAWSARRKGQRGPESRGPTALHAAEPVWLLELSPERFEQAFPEGCSALACIEAAEQVHAVSLDASSALQKTQELANVRTAELFHLLEGARVVTPDGVLLKQGRVPDSYFLLLEGKFVFAHPGTEDTELVAPAVVGLGHLIAGRALEADVRAEAAATVLRLSGETLWQLFHLDPDFQRAIVRSNEVSPDHLPDPGSASDSSVLLVLPSSSLLDERQDVAGVVGKLTDLLAERVARHLYDRVMVLHLLPAGSPPREPEVLDYMEGFEGPTSNECPWVEHRWAPIDAGLAAAVKEAIKAPVPDRSTGRPRGRAEVVLLDGSGLDRRTLVERGVELAGACKLIHMTSVPGELAPIPFVLSGIPTLHVGVLPADPPGIGVGYSMSRANATLKEAKGLANKARAAAGGLAEIAAVAGQNAVLLGKHFAQSAAEDVRGVETRAWPIGAARVRFQPPLLKALAQTAAAPVHLDDLNLDDAMKKATIATLDRWARAITSRRVGLTLGGGGTYGIIHVPLIERILERGLPIDMVAGASVGSSVGAYFAVLGGEGLRLFVDHAFGLNMASLASAVTSAVFQTAVAWDLGIVPLIDTEIPFFPVVTDADAGIEWDVRHGSYALGVRASGSLPPFLGPTVIGDRRYLDGGLVANVPVNVLKDEGAALLVASNPIANVSPLGRASDPAAPGLRPFVELAHEMSPRRRIEDLFRMIPLIFRTAGDAQTAVADIAFRPTARDVSFFSTFSKADVERGKRSPDLAQAVQRLEDRFRALLRHAPSRMHIERGRNELMLHSPIGFTEEDAVAPGFLPLVTELAQFLNQADGARITRLGIRVSAEHLDSAARCARSLLDALRRAGVAGERLAVVDGAKIAEGWIVNLPILAMVEDDPEADRKLAEANARAAKAERSALARGLTMAAEWNCRRGDLDLGRLLALEAAALDPCPSTDAVLRLALARRGWTVRRLPAGTTVQHLAFSPDGRRLAVGSADGVVRVWDVAVETERGAAQAKESTNEPLATIPHPSTGDPGIAGVAWSRDGLLATAGFDERVKVHRVAADGAVTLLYEGDTGTWDQWGVAFAPEGARLLGTAGGGRSKVGLWDGGAEPLRVVDHGSKVNLAAFSPDGSRVAAGTERGKLLVWSQASPAVQEVAAARGAIVDLAWSPQGGGQLAFACDNFAVICEASTTGGDPSSSPPPPSLGTAGRKLEGHTKPVRSVAYDASGERLVTASDDGTARVWDAQGRFRMNLRDDDGALRGAAWRPRARAIATWSEGGTGVIWDAETGDQLARLLGHQAAINDAAWSPDGRRLATGSGDGFVRVWDPFVSAQVGQNGHEGGWHPKDPRLAAAASGDGSAVVWDPTSGVLVARLLDADGAGPAAVAWSSDGALCFAGRAGTVRVWRTGSWDAPLQVLAEDTFDPGQLQIHPSPDAKYLAVRRSQSVTVWDLSASPLSRRRLDTADEGSPVDVAALAWDPRRPGRLAASRWVGWRSVAVFDLSAGDAPIFFLEGSRDGVWSIAYRADGELVAIGSNDGQAYVHSAEDGRLLGAIEHAAAVKCVAWHPGGQLLATGDGGRTAGVFQIAAAPFASRQVSARGTHLDAVSRVAFGPDGTVMASGSAAGRVYLWRRAAGTEEWSITSILEGHTGEIQTISWSPDGARLITASIDGTTLVHVASFAELFAAVGALPGPAQMTQDDWLRFFGRGTPYRATWPQPFPRPTRP